MLNDQNDDAVQAVIDQLAERGAASIKVKDGQLWYFTRETLERLLAKAIESGTDVACVFIVSGAQA